MRRHVRVRDDPSEVGLVLLEGDALVVDFLRVGGVVGAEEDDLAKILLVYGMGGGVSTSRVYGHATHHLLLKGYGW